MDLNRFLEAQGYTYKIALREIKNGNKCSCWMWYIFPQLKALGRSSKAKYYGIEDLNEAKSYISDSTLGGRLTEICEVLLVLDTNDAFAVFGSPDNMKLKSSMTLFEIADPNNKVFGKVLDKFFGGERDERTLDLLIT